jgi:hypothetical protein
MFIQEKSSTEILSPPLTSSNKTRDANIDINKKADVATPTKTLFSATEKTEANCDPTNGANSAIYTKFSIRLTLHSL